MAAGAWDTTWGSDAGTCIVRTDLESELAVPVAVSVAARKVDQRTDRVTLSSFSVDELETMLMILDYSMRREMEHVQRRYLGEMKPVLAEMIRRRRVSRDTQTIIL